MLLDTENWGGGWQPIGEDQRDSGMDRKEIYQEHNRVYRQGLRTLPEVSAGRGTI